MTVKNTWGKRCNTLLFMSSQNDSSFPTIGLNVSEGRKHLGEKTYQAFKYVYERHFDDADWFMKADDDTYVIIENLRYFLSDENPDEPLYIGQHFKSKATNHQTFAPGGAYILSKEALRRFGDLGLKDEKKCQKTYHAEDVMMGKCMENLNVPLKTTQDALGRSRFHTFAPHVILANKFPSWFRDHDFDKIGGGMKNISNYAISFHWVSPEIMQQLELLLYHLRPYGINEPLQKLNVES